MKSVLMTRDSVRKAFDILKPALDREVANAGEGSPLFTRPHLHVVVLDPTKRWSEGATIKEAILEQYSWGDLDAWEHPYGEIARGKALVTWRTGLPTGQVQNAPHLYVEGDVKYRGSWISVGGVIVAVSGQKDYVDEMVAKWICATIEALATRKFQSVLEAGGHYVY